MLSKGFCKSRLIRLMFHIELKINPYSILRSACMDMDNSHRHNVSFATESLISSSFGGQLLLLLLLLNLIPSVKLFTSLLQLNSSTLFSIYIKLRKCECSVPQCRLPLLSSFHFDQFHREQNCFIRTNGCQMDTDRSKKSGGNFMM